MFPSNWLTLALLLALTLDAPSDVDYARDVKPVLAARCYACHGALKAEAGLRVDTVAAMTDEAGIVVPGDSAASAILGRVSDADPETRMPPGHEGAPLTGEEIAALKAWIEAGAPAPADDKPEADPREHWAFRAPVRPEVPETPAESLHPVDAFLTAKRAERGLNAARPAEPRLLLRRLYLDLIGLPPTLAELEAFAADPSEAAYQATVDRLLADERYAQRWARHWMDVWRYSDWWGLGAEVRNSQKHIWRWRDWIVDSVAADLPYDEMIRQMLAADELYPTEPDKLRATGYLVRNYFKFNRDTWLDETVEHTGKAFLGLTLNCARCHDHKYDPVSTVEYYQLRAFFEPYQIRTDFVTGKTEVESDGLPRVFDCQLEAPTYRYLRGDSKQPVKDEPLRPALPELLQFAEFPIEPVALPAEAYRPGLKPSVVQAHRDAGLAKVAAAEAALVVAEAGVAKARELAAHAPAAAAAPTERTPPLVETDFRMMNEAAWSRDAGMVEIIDGQLQLTGTAAARGELSWKSPMPRDFEATFQFMILDGPMWRSVGIVFDRAGASESLVYASAVAGGSKVQFSYRQDGTDHYPAEAMQGLPIELGKPVTLTVRVRDTLVNVDVNGSASFAYRMPVARRDGTLHLIAFDATARLERLVLRPLGSDAVLRPAATDPAREPSVAEAEASRELAALELELAGRRLDALELASDADRLRWAEKRADPAAAIQAAARAQRRVEAGEAAVAVAALLRERASLLATQVQPTTPEVTADVDARMAAAEAKRAEAEARIENPGESYVSLRGAIKSVESPTETAEAAAAAEFPATSSGRRTALANWIADRRNPLTARVAVNHVWTRHFGEPLVPSVFDFGRKGRPTEHPELLDWLAVEFMDSGWSFKHLHRLLVTSQAYRMSSASAGVEANQTLDPENRYLWRMNTNRMEAQVLRDSLLSLAGKLDTSRGGPSLPLEQAVTSERRSLYFVHSHNEHDRFLAAFDDAGVQECYRRDRSVVPQQALALFNSRQAIEAARGIALRLGAGDPAIEDERFISRAFNALLASDATEAEQAACRKALAAWRELQIGAGAEQAVESRVHLIEALLNHNDFITVR